MSRVATGNTVTVAPTNNIYTALAAAAVIAQILGLIVLFIRAGHLGGLF
ncbi:MAG TPA: hypothetical protein VGR35_13820 [Tepidisphaeraceae bacterium]|nr:hypothetical protein [Tepidisphaeraceae bacterium]